MIALLILAAFSAGSIHREKMRVKFGRARWQRRAARFRRSPTLVINNSKHVSGRVAAGRVHLGHV